MLPPLQRGRKAAVALPVLSETRKRQRWLEGWEGRDVGCRGDVGGGRGEWGERGEKRAESAEV